MKSWDELFAMVQKLKGEETFSLTAQAEKIIEEANEFLDASDRDSWCEELGDLIHACIVLLRMRGVDVAEAFLENVIAKNRERGYYEDVANG